MVSPRNRSPRLFLKSRKPFLEAVSTGSGSDLVSDQQAILLVFLDRLARPIRYRGGVLTSSAPSPLKLALTSSGELFETLFDVGAEAVQALEVQHPARVFRRQSAYFVEHADLLAREF